MSYQGQACCAVFVGCLLGLLAAPSCGGRGDTDVTPLDSTTPEDGDTSQSLPAVCSLLPAPGTCSDSLTKYWHDPWTGICTPFIWTGCEGNGNRFDTIADCQALCDGGPVNLDQCDGAGTCAIVTSACCDGCGAEDVTTLVAVASGATEAYRAGLACDDVECDACQSVTEAQLTSQYFGARCELGKCQLFDVRESALTNCASDGDCILRNGLSCCESCDGSGFVAIRADADIASIACPLSAQGCTACDSVAPEGLSAVCSGGRCTVQGAAH
jgi:hypothetical protein